LFCALTIVDFGNVEKWKFSLGWSIDINNLSRLIKRFSLNRQSNRRFYYGSDYGKDEKATILFEWSRLILERAQWNKLEVVTKRVKYIHSPDNKFGFEKKCDLDVEMAIDLIKYRDDYDTIVLFSGDGDLMHAIRYLKDRYGKDCMVFGARNHVGREVFDAQLDGYVNKIFFVEDFEYRLRMDRFGHGSQKTVR